MRQVAEEDAEELERWEMESRRAKAWDAHRRSAAAEVLRRSTVDGLRALCFRRWLQFLTARAEAARRRTVALCLSRCTAGGLLREYYRRLRAFQRLQKERREKSAAGEHLMRCTVQGLRHVYWKRISDYRHKRRRDAERQRVVEVVLRLTCDGVRRSYYRKLWRWWLKHHVHKTRRRVAERLLLCTAEGTRRLRYFLWQGWAMLRSRQHRQTRLATVLMPSLMDAQLRRVYLHKAVKWTLGSRWRALRGPVSAALNVMHWKHQLGWWYRRWRAWEREAPLRRAQAGVDAASERLLSMSRRLDAQKACPLRAKLRAIREEAAALRQTADGLRAACASSEDEIRGLRVQLNKGEKLLEGGISGVMNRLKEISLNFSADQELINRVARRSASEPIEKIFLEGHIEVKTTIVRLSGETHLSTTEEWPVDRILHKIPGFELRKIHTAIKTMVVAFDRMSQLALFQMATDDEIVLNGENLIKLFRRTETAVRR
eukprot:TRINITY_DN18126_c0_g1_i2.p2 TRINITY_DN18126_c0_g1~~TRINITY_DN18126_c0_g1_i2.p2  ORF type:complete len:487 (+),score=174.51 TRINITY_DN18126_c0_g1_i2:1199-2659(+)